MDGRKIDGAALSEAGMIGGDSVGYCPPGGKGVVLVDWEEGSGGDYDQGGKWVLTARTPDKKTDIVMTVNTVDQVRKACDLAGCPLPIVKAVWDADAAGRRFDTTPPGDFVATVRLLDEWNQRVKGRGWKIDYTAGVISLSEPGKPTWSLSFRDADDAARKVVALVDSDPHRPKAFAAEPFKGILSDREQAEACGLTGEAKCPAVECPPDCPESSGGDEAECGDLLCGAGDEIHSAESLADEWLAGGDDAAELRTVDFSRSSDGQSVLLVSASTLLADGRLSPMQVVRRSYFDEDALPYLRSAIRELRGVHGLGHDMPPTTPTADHSDR